MKVDDANPPAVKIANSNGVIRREFNIRFLFTVVIRSIDGACDTNGENPRDSRGFDSDGELRTTIHTQTASFLSRECDGSM